MYAFRPSTSEVSGNQSLRYQAASFLALTLSGLNGRGLPGLPGLRQVKLQQVGALRFVAQGGENGGDLAAMVGGVIGAVGQHLPDGQRVGLPPGVGPMEGRS